MLHAYSYIPQYGICAEGLHFSAFISFCSHNLVVTVKQKVNKEMLLPIDSQDPIQYAIKGMTVRIYGAERGPRNQS